MKNEKINFFGSSVWPWRLRFYKQDAKRRVRKEPLPVLSPPAPRRRLLNHGPQLWLRERRLRFEPLPHSLPIRTRRETLS